MSSLAHNRYMIIFIIIFLQIVEILVKYNLVYTVSIEFSFTSKEHWWKKENAKYFYGYVN